MAIFQPTNIIPSSFTQGTVDAVKENMEISWQVNGNSKLEAFQIDFYLNDTASTFVWSTGRKTDNCPFYGTDRFGRPQFFTYNATRSWEEVGGFTNGNNYKFKITQWYDGVNEVIGNITANVTAGTTYYFTVPAGNTSAGAAVYFTASQNLSNKKFFYSLTTGQGWYTDSDSYHFIGMALNTNGNHDGMTLLTGEVANVMGEQLFVVQTSSNNFITRDAPTLTIYQSNDAYGTQIAFPQNTTLATSVGYFVADYVQLQNAPIKEVTWEVAQVNKGVIGDILSNTGSVDTPTLQFEYNGFFNGQSYGIRCYGKADYGTDGQQDFTSGWRYFNISYTANTYDGNFTVQCLNKENATLLEWESVTVISGTYTPPEGSEGQYSFENNAVVLPANSSVVWNKVGAGSTAQDMNFTDWTAVCKVKLEQTTPEIVGFNSIQQISSGQGYSLKYSPDGKLLLYYDFNARHMLVYNVGDSQLTLRGYLLSNGAITPLPSIYYGANVHSMVFSNNNLFAVSTTNALFLYSYNNEAFTLLDSTGTNTRGSSIAFSPDGNILVRGGTEQYDTIVYSIANNTLEPLYSLQREGEDIRLDTSTIDFNQEGTLMCMGFAIIGGGEENQGVAVFDVNNTQITYKGELLPNEMCYNLVFNKETFTDVLVVATQLNYYYFRVVNNELILAGTITNSPIIYQAISRAIAFSPDGKNVLIGGQSSVSWYSIENDTLTYKGPVALPNGESWDNTIAIDWNQVNNQVAIHNDGTGPFFNQIFNTVFSESIYTPQGVFWSLGGANLSLSRQDNPLILKSGSTQLANITVPNNSTSIATIVTPTTLNAYFYDNNGLISQSSTPISYTQQPITSVSIYGGNSGATVDSVSVYQGDGSNILSLYESNPDFEPVWNSNEYQLYMTANFNGNLEGGTGTASGAGFRVYRREVGGNVLTPIANLSALQTSMKDYGIRSRKAYEYLLGVYDSNNAFMGLVTAENTIATCFKNYSLLVCDYDYDKDEYHVRKQYLFALNLSSGSVGNNNSPTLNKNFTQYPTRMPDTANYASGTLQGLIGAIYTVPALIEQIGQCKWTAKPSTMDYFDSVDLEKELYDLSTAPYQLFLRDMKGRLRMVHTNSAISMTTNIKQKQQSISISFPWVEVGDASDVTIIQTPDDYGWNNDNQVLDVQLDVDVETGELSATYPFPYNGTKFYLTGVNKENLTAKTPLGVTPAQFNLSEVAEEPDDGTVTATVTVNSEVDK